MKSSINLKSNIILKSRYNEKSEEYFLPVDFLANYKDIRSESSMNNQQLEEVRKLPFYAKRIKHERED